MFATLQENNGILNDPDQIRSAMEERGYLFIRELIDPEVALQLKRDMMATLRSYYFIEKDGSTDPMWSGGPFPTEEEWMAVYGKLVELPSLKVLANSPEVMGIMRHLVDGPVRVWNQKITRCVYPDPDATVARGAGPHQDATPSFGYSADDFFTTWYPLMEIDQSIGGLAVAPGSNHFGLIEHTGIVPSTQKLEASRAASVITPEELTWATADFRPGDVVMFSCRTIHRGMPNHSDRIRLSVDCRYQRRGANVSWLARATAKETRRMGQRIDATLSSRAYWIRTKAGEDVLKEVRTRMMEEGNPSLDRAVELVAEIQSRSQQSSVTRAPVR